MEFQIFSGSDGRLYWRLQSGKDTIATGHQGYETEEACREDIKLVKSASDAPIVVY